LFEKDKICVQVYPGCNLSEAWLLKNNLKNVLFSRQDRKASGSSEAVNKKTSTSSWEEKRKSGKFTEALVKDNILNNVNY
jgi:hypothetical protein